MESGLSQGQLGERAGVPSTMVSAYERDRRQPTVPTLTRLVKAAGFDLRLQLVPIEPHDDPLDELDSRRGAKDHRRRDRQSEASRWAEPVEVGGASYSSTRVHGGSDLPPM